MSNFMKIRPFDSRVVACGRTDRRTDGQAGMTKLLVAFRNFANAPDSAVCK